MQNNTERKTNGVLWVFITLAVVTGAFLFSTWYFNKDKKGEEIIVDNDNIEIIVTEKRDLKEIGARLDELDIDLDDILNELEF